jgi:hypothetical protein
MTNIIAARGMSILIEASKTLRNQLTGFIL